MAVLVYAVEKKSNLAFASSGNIIFSETAYLVKFTLQQLW